MELFDLKNNMNNTLTVTASPYNADNTGATESSVEIMACWNDCLSQKKWMYLPAGTYKCNLIAGGVILGLNIAGMDNLGIYGDKARILTTVDPPCCQMELSSAVQVNNFSLNGISFENTH